MKLAVNRWCLPKDWAFEKCLNEVASAGFDSIELNLDEQDGVLQLSTSDEDVAAIRTQVEAAGLKIVGVSTALGWKYPLTSADESVRAKGGEVLARQIVVASILGTDAVLCVPGMVNADTPYDVAYRRASEALKVSAGLAEQLDVKIGVENVWNRFLLSPLEMARFIDEIGSDHVRAYFDVGNVLQFGFPNQWIRILNRRIVRIHFKDFRLDVGNGKGFCLPLTGDVPWAQVITALREIGYDGWLTAEVEPHRTSPETGLKVLAESMRTILAL